MAKNEIEQEAGIEAKGRREQMGTYGKNVVADSKCCGVTHWILFINFFGVVKFRNTRLYFKRSPVCIWEG